MLHVQGSQTEKKEPLRKRNQNMLKFEKSPYLLQHATNPVKWLPWGEGAFKKAKEEDKPVFLSIGYSTCHWCHVMAHESFENKRVAALMNKVFVSIKVAVRPLLATTAIQPRLLMVSRKAARQKQKQPHVLLIYQ